MSSDKHLLFALQRFSHIDRLQVLTNSQPREDNYIKDMMYQNVGNMHIKLYVSNIFFSLCVTRPDHRELL